MSAETATPTARPEDLPFHSRVAFKLEDGTTIYGRIVTGGEVFECFATNPMCSGVSHLKRGMRHKPEAVRPVADATWDSAQAGV